MANITELQTRIQYGSSIDFASFTSTAGNLLIFATTRLRPGEPTTISTGHGVFTRVNGVNLNNRSLEVWAAISTGATAELNVDFAMSTSGWGSVIEVSGVDTSAVASAIPQSNFLNQYNGSGSPHDQTVTLNPFQQPSNAVLIFGSSPGGGETFTAEVGYTKATEVLQSGDRLAGFWQDSEDTSPTLTTQLDFRANKFVALELQQSGGGGAVSADVSVTSKKPIVLINASATISPVVSNISVTAKKPTVNITGSAVVPSPTGDITVTAKKPTVSIQSSATTPNPIANINVLAKKPLVSISSSATLPQPVADIAIISKKPVVSIIASVESLQPVADIIVLSKKPTVTVTGSVTLPLPIADISILAKKPTVRILGTVSGLVIIAPSDARLKYQPGINTLEYNPGSNKLAV